LVALFSEVVDYRIPPACAARVRLAFDTLLPIEERLICEFLPGMHDVPSRIFIFSSLALLLLCTKPPRAAAESESAKRFLVRSWQSEDGLPGNVLRSVAQAADGYLWVTTPEGVVRFDGVQFTGFEAEPDATLARLSMRGLFPMPNGDVWIATARGGLLRWHGGRLRAVHPEGKDFVPQNASVSQVFADPAGGVIAVRGSELWKIDEAGNPQLVPPTPTIEQRRVADLAAWANRGRVTATGENPRLLDRRGRVWTVTASEGITIGDAESPAAVIPVPAAESGLRVSELCEDREGNIWVATGEAGLLQVRERRVDVFSVRHGLSDRTALPVLQDQSGAWWVANKSGGLDRFAENRVSHFSVGPTRSVSALLEDHAGNLWAATRNGSVFRLENGEFLSAFTAPDAPSKVAAMAEDSNGSIWFGGVQGLARLSSGAFTVFGAEQGFPAAEVTALAIDTNDRVWVGTTKGEIFRSEGNHFVLTNSNDEIPKRPVSAIQFDSNGTVWFAVFGGGLVRWREGSFFRFSNSAGLAESRLTAVLDDNTGYLWLGSLGGIFRVAKSELDAIARGEKFSANWLRLDRADGMLSRECTGIFQPAAWRGHDGELWFPTVNGVARIRPDQLLLNPVPPPVSIEACLENGRRMPLARSPLVAGPGRTRFEIQYTGLSLAAAEKAQFRVRLSGLESNWRDAGTSRVAAYEAVPPGRYQFQVAAANADGVWNESGAAVDLVVQPHFWETKSFRAGVALAAVIAAASIGWAIARERMKRRMIAMELRHAREAERARIARDLHDDLGASLTEISMLAQITAEETHAAPTRAPLEDIASRAHALVGALDEIVWAVNPRHDTLASLTDYLSATTADFVAAAGCSLRIDVPRDLPEWEVDAERRHTLLLAVREALHNVVKHSGASEVSLKVEVLSNGVRVDITDNGRGFDPRIAPHGDGLGNLRDRLEAVGGKCIIRSTPQSGTQVSFHLPLAVESSHGAGSSNGFASTSPSP
jgi:signal transduction histidine kinase/ligand-binding sensor domain-containing protein